MERYLRHTVLSEIGPNGQQRLNDAKVLVIGAGGLGCPALQYLAAAGVGTIGIVDFDSVEESNLQRQVLFGIQDIGQNKAKAAKSRLLDLNPHINIHAYTTPFSVENALEYVQDYDVILDGTDNFGTRYLVNDACVLSDKPWVYGAIFKFEGQVTVFNWKQGPTYRCLFPNPPASGSIPSCSEVGVLGVLPGVIGNLMANEAIKMIVGYGEVLSGQISLFDAKTTQFQKLQIPRSETEIERIKKEAVLSTKPEYKVDCNFTMKTIEINIKEALAMEDGQFIDIREAYELPKVDEVEPRYIPMGELLADPSQIDRSQPAILFCQAGVRSMMAATQLHGLDYSNVYSLRQGAAVLKQVVQTESS